MCLVGWVLEILLLELLLDLSGPLANGVCIPARQDVTYSVVVVVVKLHILIDRLRIRAVPVPLLGDCSERHDVLLFRSKGHVVNYILGYIGFAHIRIGSLV